MSEQEIPGIPAGYRAERWGLPKINEKFLLDDNIPLKALADYSTAHRLIVEPIPKPEPEPPVTLSPCPFCGESAELIINKEDYGTDYRIECSTCCGQVTGSSESLVIEGWNRRHTVVVDQPVQDDLAKAFAETEPFRITGPGKYTTSGEFTVQIIREDKSFFGYLWAGKAVVKTDDAFDSYWTDSGKYWSNGTASQYDIVSRVSNSSSQIDTSAKPVEAVNISPDPGPGWRLIDPAVDTPMAGDEFWSALSKGWKPREQNEMLTRFVRNNAYRRRLPIPEPVINSPDDWVEITDPRHVLRKEIDQCRLKLRDEKPFVPVWRLDGLTIAAASLYEFRCRRRDLPKPPVPEPDTEEITFHQVVMPGIGRKRLSWVSFVNSNEIPTGETVTVRVKTAGKS